MQTISDRAIPDPNEEPTMSTRRVAICLGISEEAARDAARSGEIPSIRIGRRYFVPTAELRRMVGIDPTPEPSTTQEAL